MKRSRKSLSRLRSLQDAQIDMSDIPELDDAFWKRARVVLPQPKKAISLRLDDEVLRWYRARGKGYQSLMNAVLKSYAEAARER